MAAAPVTPSKIAGLIGTQKDVDVPRECSSDEVVVGARAQNRIGSDGASSAGILVQFDLLCGSIDVNDDGKPIVTPAAEWLAFEQYEQGSGNTSDGVCPVNQVAHQMSGSTFAGDGGQWTQSVILSCQPLLLTADGSLRVDNSAPATLVTAGNGRANTAGQRIEGPFCAENAPAESDVVVRGYRPQNGGHGIDGYAPSCATFGTDWSDAPETYGAASHPVNSGTYLGAVVDAESAAMPSAAADGDDALGGQEPNPAVDDEDGTTVFNPALGQDAISYLARVRVTNRLTNVAAKLVGWIDFNVDGKFDENEAATADVPPGSDNVRVDLRWNNLDTRITASAASFARLRVAAGSTLSAATPTGGGAAGEVEDYPIELVKAEPGLKFTKNVVKIEDRSGDGLTNTGDVITYGFGVTNVGQITLSDVTVTDPLPGLSPMKPGPWVSGEKVLRRGEAMGYTAEYTITQADTERGVITNTASVSASSPSGQPVTAPDASTTTPLDQRAALSFTKQGSLSVTDASAGDLVDYTFTVTNTGSLSATDVEVTDEKKGLSKIRFAKWPGTPGVLAPGQSVTASATYPLTQADIEAGKVSNTATVTGASSAGPIPVVDSTSVVPIQAVAKIAIQKGAVFEGDAEPVPGDTISYRFTVSNVGAKTANDIDIADELPGLTAITYPEGEDRQLAPGEKLTASASYVLTQGDIDGGKVSNTALARATTLSGTVIPEVTDTAVVELDDLATLVIKKAATFAGGSTATPGESVEYTFTVTNRGNVTVTDVAIEDLLPKLSLISYGAWPSSPGTLAPGESVRATANYAVTEADIAAGKVSNTATVAGEFRGDAVVSERSTAVVPLQPEPAPVPLPAPVMLPSTGAEPFLGGAAVLLLLVLGAVAVVSARRRERTES